MQAREREALQRLWTRACARTQRRHDHNTAQADRPQCLMCGAAATKRECEAGDHVFCATRACQRALWTMHGLMRLGEPGKRKKAQKRGVVVLEERKPELFLEEVALPDDVVCTLVLWAFDYAIETREDYTELRELRTLSKQFRRVIDECVTPYIRFIAEEVMIEEGMTTRDVAAYSGLREIDLSPACLVNPSLLPKLRFLDTLELREWHQRGEESTFNEEYLLSCVRLKRLRLFDVPVKDETLQGLTRLEELTLRQRKFTQGALVPLPRLRVLTLQMKNYEMVEIDQLTQLEELHLRSARIDTESLEKLANLRVLQLQWTARPADRNLRPLSGLRGLDIRECGNTDDALMDMVEMESLLIDDTVRITGESVRGMPGLRSLAISGGDPHAVQPFGVGILPLLRELTWLSLRFNDRGVPGEDVAALTGLTYLDISTPAPLSPLIGDAALAPLVNLRTLRIVDNAMVTDAALVHMSQLTALDISYNPAITDAGLASLINLVTLDISANYLITNAGLAPLLRLEALYMNSYDGPVTFPELAKLLSLELVVSDSALLRSYAQRVLSEAGVELRLEREKPHYTQPLHFPSAY